MIVDPPVEDRNPLRGLLTVVVNAIHYATSPGAEPELRRPEPTARRPKTQRGAPAAFTSDEVYFLPGAIEISALRGYQALERLPDGRSTAEVHGSGTLEARSEELGRSAHALGRPYWNWSLVPSQALG